MRERKPSGLVQVHFKLNSEHRNWFLKKILSTKQLQIQVLSSYYTLKSSDDNKIFLKGVVQSALQNWNNATGHERVFFKQYMHLSKN